MPPLVLSTSSNDEVKVAASSPPRSRRSTITPPNANTSLTTTALSPSTQSAQTAQIPSPAEIADAERAKQNAVVALWHNRSKRSSLSSPTHNSTSNSSATSTRHNNNNSSPPVVRFRTSLRNTILTAFNRRGWKETSSETEWDIFWCNKEWMKTILNRIHLEPNQRINHFRNYFELTRKDLLIKNLKKYKSFLFKSDMIEEANAYDFWPETYNLPSEYPLFVETFKKAQSSSLSTSSSSSSSSSITLPAAQQWIMKPIGSSQGKGIFLFDKLQQIQTWNMHRKTIHHEDEKYNNTMLNHTQPNNHHKEKDDDDTNNNNNNNGDNNNNTTSVERYIVQRYLNNPLLIGHKKFDLRIYVLTTSFHPLTVYIHREGFARFSSTFYTNIKNNINNPFVHLTNVAIQKKGEFYDRESGGKWDLKSLKLYLMHKYSNNNNNNSNGKNIIDLLFKNITLIVIRSLLAVQRLMIHEKNSFELYGYDILIDAHLKPWLIEVNASPSLTANTSADEQMKLSMLNDMLDVIDLENIVTNNNNNNQQQSPKRVGGFDLIYDKFGYAFDVNSGNNDADHRGCTVTLGTHNDRRQSAERWNKVKIAKANKAMTAEEKKTSN